MSGLLTRSVGSIWSSTRLLRSSSTFSPSTPQSSVDTGSSNNSKLSIEDYLDLKIEEREKETYIEGVPVSTGRDNFLVPKKSEACALCRLNLRNLDYTDVMILSQWIKRDGSLATYHESKLCSKQYKKVKNLVEKAQRCNLIKRPADYLVPGPWHDLNTYLEFDRKRDQPMKIIKKQYWKM